MLLCLWIQILLGKSEVDNEYFVPVYPEANHEVVCFEVSVNVTYFMELLKSVEYLSPDMECGFFREAFVTVLARQHTISETNRRGMTLACP